jgi:vacuolar-type H+-ATPase subunit E/Vma4
MSKVKQGLAAIANEVLDDIRKEAEAIIRKAEKESEENLRTAKDEADRTYEAIISDASAKTDAEKRRIASLTQVEKRNRLLQTKEELVDFAFNETQARLKTFVKTGDYHNCLVNLIEEAAKKLDAKSLIIYVNSTDKAWLLEGELSSLSKKLRTELKLAEETLDCIGGCKVHTTNEKVLFDNTLENRLQQLTPHLRLEVAQILFGKEG